MTILSKFVLSDNARLVLKYINEHGPAMNNEISAGICRSKSCVRLSCDRLQSYHYIEFKNRRWKITFAGRIAILDD